MPAAAGGRRTIETFGLFEHRCEAALAADVAAIGETDVVIVCVRGNGHRTVFETIAPVLRQSQSVIISSHCSLGALYLSQLVAERGLALPIIAWATTLTGGPMSGERVYVRLLRGELDVATIPASAAAHGLALSRQLFSARFTEAENLLAVALSNLNPPIHMASALLNFTRMERAEIWDNFGCITEGVGRLIEDLDAERLAVAAAFGLTVRTAREHYLKSFPALAPGTVAAMARQVAMQRQGSSPGPATIQTRYVTEDVPFGIYPLIGLARVAGSPTPLHEAGLQLLGSVYGRDFAADNDLLPKVGLERLDSAALQGLVRDGWPTTGRQQP
jgi:opine dehydrogenase